MSTAVSVTSQSCSSASSPGLARATALNATLPFSKSSPVGIVAGWGRYPLVVAQRLKEEGVPLYIAAVRDHADPELEKWCDRMEWFGVAKLGGHIRFFARHRVQRVALAGKLFKDKLLYGKGGWWRHLPDWQCIISFYPHFVTRSRDTRDDSLLTDVCNAYLRRGIEIVPGTDFAPHLLVEEGVLTKRQPSFAEQKDIQFGWAIAKQMGTLDIGQGVTVLDQTVLAVEAVEGTDALISRTGTICPRGGFTLVKVAKPQQDPRFDLPTIGLRTLQLLHQAGGRCLAIEAGKTILVEREEVLSFAADKRIAIVAIRSPAVATEATH
jgi:DUF1009 family protein